MNETCTGCANCKYCFNGQCSYGEPCLGPSYITHFKIPESLSYADKEITGHSFDFDSVTPTDFYKITYNFSTNKFSVCKDYSQSNYITPRLMITGERCIVFLYAESPEEAVEAAKREIKAMIDEGYDVEEEENYMWRCVYNATERKITIYPETNGKIENKKCTIVRELPDERGSYEIIVYKKDYDEALATIENVIKWRWR